MMLGTSGHVASVETGYGNNVCAVLGIVEEIIFKKFAVFQIYSRKP